MKVHNYDYLTKKYVSTTDAVPDSSDPTKWMLPAHATFTAPPSSVPKYQSPVWRNSHWVLVPDYTGYRLWDTVEAIEVSNHLQVGDTLPANVTADDPSAVTFPKWDGTQWVHDARLEAEYKKRGVVNPAATSFRKAMDLLEDDDQRHTILGVPVLTDADRQAVEKFILDTSNYLVAVEKATPVQMGAMPSMAPVWPLSYDPDDLRIFRDKNATPQPASAQGVIPGVLIRKWIPRAAFTKNTIVFGSNNEGLFVVPADYTSGSALQDDVSAGQLVLMLSATSGTP